MPKLIKKPITTLVAATGLLFSAYSIADVPSLSVNGSQILVGNQHIGLSGNAFFWSNESYGAERFYNANVVNWLKTDWNANIVRASMGVEEYGGYISHPRENRARVEAIVDAAIAEDMYVIIDWHTHHAELYEDEAVIFFQDMAEKYGEYENVIYEVYNEPIDVSWSDTVKPYAESVIGAIREIDPDNLVIVGSPTWSQDVHLAAADPITQFDNIAYTLHFYAGTHTQFLRERAEQAMNDGIAIMVTEWGTVNANGDGSVAVDETNRWVEWMDQYNLTHLNWSVHDKVEGASILQPGVSSTGNWSTSDLTTSGTFVRNIVREYNEGVDFAIGGNSGSEPTPEPTPVPTPEPIQPNPDNSNVVIMEKRGTSFSIDGNNGARNSEQVYLWNTNTDNVNQQWIEVDRGNGYYSYQKISTAVCIDGGNGGGNGQEVILLTCDSSDQNQQWRKVSLTNGSFRLEKRNAPNYSIDGNNGATQRQGLYLWNSSDNNVNQQWTFLAIGDSSTITTPEPTPEPTPAPTPAPTPIDNNDSTSCEFVVLNEWNSGFIGEVRVNNNGSSAVNEDWSVSFQFTDGSEVISSWNGDFTGSNVYTVAPFAWNRNISANGQTRFGVQVNKGSLNAAAQAPVVNGILCNR